MFEDQLDAGQSHNRQALALRKRYLESINRA